VKRPRDNTYLWWRSIRRAERRPEVRRKDGKITNRAEVGAGEEDLIVIVRDTSSVKGAESTRKTTPPKNRALKGDKTIRAASSQKGNNTRTCSLRPIRGGRSDKLTEDKGGGQLLPSKIGGEGDPPAFLFWCCKNPPPPTPHTTPHPPPPRESLRFSNTQLRNLGNAHKKGRSTRMGEQLCC